MLQTKRIPTQYNIVVNNKPGELAKLTKFLSDENINVSALQIANLGNKASIQFSTPMGLNLQEGLRKTGLRAHIG